jgi:hypothetical protein
MILLISRVKATFIHPASVNHTKRVKDDNSPKEEKQIFAFWEKRQNLSNVGTGPGQMSHWRISPYPMVIGVGQAKSG